MLRQPLHSEPSVAHQRHRLRAINPFDDVAQMQIAALRAQRYRRIAKLSFAAALSMIVPMLIVYMFPLDEIAGEEKRVPKPARKDSILYQDRMDSSTKRSEQSFEGLPVVVAAGGNKLVAQDPIAHKDIELVPTGSSYIPHFPKTIMLPNSHDPSSERSVYSLLGLGIRKVSFLNIQVYVVGFYVKNSSLQTLQSALTHYINPEASALILEEKGNLKSALLDPEESRKLWEQILYDKQSGIDTAIRVVPVRNTDFNHLRDGWITGITNRIQEATARQKAAKGIGTESSTDSNFEDEGMGLAMREFKSMLTGRGKAPKGSVILLTRRGDGELEVLQQRDPEKGTVESIGIVKDERVSNLIWLGYLGGQNVSSKDARNNIAEGAVSLAERPVGTAENQIT
jgi:hypothetical protein